jgi:GGDEF domain-containing protein
VAAARLHTPGTSIGTASAGGKNADIATLHAAADAELYIAKQKRIAEARETDMQRRYESR